MKRWISVLALAVCLTACGNTPGQPAAGGISSDAVQSKPARPAESELILDELPVGFEQVAEIGWCDFDRDGAEEEYKTLVRMDEDSGMGTYYVSIGGSTAEGDAFTMDAKPYLASLDGETVQLVLFDNGMSDDPMIHIYGWNGESLYKVGEIYAAPENVKLTNGRIIAPERWDVMQNAWFDLHYTVENNAIVRLEDPNKWYSYIGETNLHTLVDVQLFENADLTDHSSFTVAAGELVEITGVLLDREIENPSEGDMPMYWVRLRVEDTGKSGFLLANSYQCRTADSAPVSAQDLFDGLVYAG
ncbi:MAG: hypothetical protein IJ452_07845 [Butyricicoccus sp.]|nr:hypothetical protein [Butyricicoccus sp.]MBQ8586176.1 hypothetical protein [Butyricicoccus sp.]